MPLHTRESELLRTWHVAKGLSSSKPTGGPEPEFLDAANLAEAIAAVAGVQATLPLALPEPRLARVRSAK